MWTVTYMSSSYQWLLAIIRFSLFGYFWWFYCAILSVLRLVFVQLAFVIWLSILSHLMVWEDSRPKWLVVCREKRKRRTLICSCGMDTVVFITAILYATELHRQPLTQEESDEICHGMSLTASLSSVLLGFFI